MNWISIIIMPILLISLHNSYLTPQQIESQLVQISDIYLQQYYDVIANNIKILDQSNPQLISIIANVNSLYLKLVYKKYDDDQQYNIHKIQQINKQQLKQFIAQQVFLGASRQPMISRYPHIRKQIAYSTTKPNQYNRRQPVIVTRASVRMESGLIDPSDNNNLTLVSTSPISAELAQLNTRQEQNLLSKQQKIKNSHKTFNQDQYDQFIFQELNQFLATQQQYSIAKKYLQFKTHLGQYDDLNLNDIKFMMERSRRQIIALDRQSLHNIKFDFRLNQEIIDKVVQQQNQTYRQTNIDNNQQNSDAMQKSYDSKQEDRYIVRIGVNKYNDVGIMKPLSIFYEYEFEKNKEGKLKKYVIQSKSYMRPDNIKMEDIRNQMYNDVLNYQLWSEAVIEEDVGLDDIDIDSIQSIKFLKQSKYQLNDYTQLVIEKGQGYELSEQMDSDADNIIDRINIQKDLENTYSKKIDNSQDNLDIMWQGIDKDRSVINILTKVINPNNKQEQVYQMMVDLFNNMFTDIWNEDIKYWGYFATTYDTDQSKTDVEQITKEITQIHSSISSL